MKARVQVVNSIRKDEDRSRSVRNAMHRDALRRQSEIAMSNQKLAVKLFTQKPTYEVLKHEKDFKEHKSRLERISKVGK